VNNKPTDIDVQIGELIRTHRLRRGQSQEWLAKRAGVSYQQIHKYETGANRVSVSRLLDISSALGIDARQIIAELI
jgi:transcriptional regulator with XRE-family HTH domain